MRSKITSPLSVKTDRRRASITCTSEELLARHSFKTQREASLAIFDYIEGLYNPRRRHSALGYLSPNN
jgi:transposase InsO family protein